MKIKLLFHMLMGHVGFNYNHINLCFKMYSHFFSNLVSKNNLRFISIWMAKIYVDN